MHQKFSFATIQLPSLLVALALDLNSLATFACANDQKCLSEPDTLLTMDFKFVDEDTISTQYRGSCVRAYALPLWILIHPRYQCIKSMLSSELSKLSPMATDAEKIDAAYMAVAAWSKALSNMRVSAGSPFVQVEELLAPSHLAAPLLYSLLKDLKLANTSVELVSCYYHKEFGHSWVRLKPGTAAHKSDYVDLDPLEYPARPTLLKRRGYGW